MRLLPCAYPTGNALQCHIIPTSPLGFPFITIPSSLFGFHSSPSHPHPLASIYHLPIFILWLPYITIPSSPFGFHPSQYG